MIIFNLNNCFIYSLRRNLDRNRKWKPYDIDWHKKIWLAGKYVTQFNWPYQQTNGGTQNCNAAIKQEI